MKIQVSKVFNDIYTNYDPASTVKQGFVLEGGSRCFSENTFVITIDGPKQINNIVKGDLVKTYNENTNQIEYKPVLSVFKMDNKKKSYRVTLKNGKTIECTDDHKFYYKGGWISLKQLLSL